MNLVLPLCIVLACLPFFVQAQMNIDAGGVRINEFLTIPATSSSVGWIELHNPTGDAIDLTGCRVQDASASKDGVAIFTLASVVLQPGAFLLLLATGSTLPLDASAGASPGALETPLSLSGGGGKLFLMNEAGAVLSYVAYDIQFPAVSFGQRSAGLQRFGYFTAPSPGAANSDTSWACGFAVPPQLSVDRGFFASAFTLAVAAGKPPSKKKLIEGGAASAGALYEFRYTTDGSEPGPQSSAFDAAAPMTISTTTVMRVRAFINNAPCAYLPSPPTTKTYLFLDQVARQPNAVPNFPQSDRVYPTDFGAEPKRGLQINGELLADPTFLEQFRAGLSVIPSVSLVFDAQEMFGAGGVYDRQRSSSRRIRGSFEILYPDDAGLPNDASDVGINGHSWPMIKRSLSVSFSSKYANGAANPSPDFFNRNPNDPLGTSVKVVKINALNLIGGHNRAFTSLWTPQVTLTEDQLHRSLQIKAAGYGIHGRHCHVYLNGVYWGVHNAMETLNEKWAATTFGGDADDYFYIQDNKINQIAMSGDATDFNATMLATFADLGIEANYARVALLMDLKSFSQYLVHSSFTRASLQQPPTTWIEALWRRLSASANFMRIFADVAHELLVLPTGALSVPAVANQWQALTGGPLSSAIVGESGRWGDLFGTVKTRENTYMPAYVKIAGLIQTNTAQMIQALRDEQYYPAIMPPSGVTLTRLFDNRTSAQHQLLLVFDSIPPQDATAWVTFDGSDPCNFDSKPNSAAQAVSLSPSATEHRVTLSTFLVDGASTYAFRVRVRVLDALQQWSAQAAADFASPTRAPLKISAAARVCDFFMVSRMPALILIGLAAWN